jgi:AraC-like DNA-binding protein
LLHKHNLDSYGSFGFVFSDPAPSLGIQLRSVGWEKQTSTDYNWDGMKRRETQTLLFQYTLNGCGEMELPDRTIQLEREQALLVRIPGEHRYYLPEQSSSWEFVYMMIRGSAIPELWPQLELDSTAGVHRFALDHPLIKFLIHAYKQAANRTIVDSYQASAIAYQFMMELLRSDFSYSEQQEGAADRIQLAIDYMQEHYAELNGLEDIGQSAGLSKYHFTRLFHKTTGLTPIQYLTNVRMEKSAELLRFTEWSVEDIARMIGYANGNYFCKIFRKRTGLSPGEFRSGKDSASVDYLTFR